MFDAFNAPKLNRYFIIGLIGLSLLVYILTLAPTVLLADAGEFQFVPWLPGIAHPTGYPLYILLGWLFSHLLPFGEVAWRLNLFSAVAGAATIPIVYLISQTLTTRIWPEIPPGVHRLIAAGAALTFAFSHTFWSQVIIAEVYGLHALFVALVLWACLSLPKPAAPSPGSGSSLSFKAAWKLSLIFGFSLTHHRTMALMIPAILLYLWLSGWRKLTLGDGLKLALVGALPSLLYLYLPLIAPRVPYAQLQLSPTQTLILYEPTFNGFLKHILGQVFSGEVQPGGIGPDRVRLSLGFLRQQVGWLGGGLGLLGLISLVRRPALLALTGGSFLSFLIFNLIYFIGDINVLFIPCWLILSLWLGLGWLQFSVYLSRAIVKNKQARLTDTPVLINAGRRLEQNMSHLLLVIFSSLFLALPLGLLLTRYAEVDQRQNTMARQAWLEILAQDLPPEAILLSNDRNEMMPLWYYQYVEKRRPDWLGLFPLITPEPEVANIGRLLDQALASGRPVYLVKPMAGLELKADLSPLSPLPHAQLVQAARPKLTPDQALALNYDDLLTIIGYDQTQSANQLAITLYWQARQGDLADDYTSYVHLVDSTGSGRAQSQDHRLGGVYYPTSLWQPGEILRDQHTILLPDHLPPGEYTLMAGLYLQPEPGVIHPLGEAQPLGKVQIGSISEIEPIWGPRLTLHDPAAKQPPGEKPAPSIHLAAGAGRSPTNSRRQKRPPRRVHSRGCYGHQCPRLAQIQYHRAGPGAPLSRPGQGRQPGTA